MNREDISKNLGANIKQYRTKLGVSQESLAFLAGMHPSYLGCLERGEKCPTIETVFKICEALHISVAELLDFETPPSSHTNVIPYHLEKSIQKLSHNQQRCILEIMENIVALCEDRKSETVWPDSNPK